MERSFYVSYAFPVQSLQATLYPRRRDGGTEEGPETAPRTKKPPSSGRCRRRRRRGSCAQRAKIAWKCHRAPERKQHGSAIACLTNKAGEWMLCSNIPLLRRFFARDIPDRMIDLPSRPVPARRRGPPPPPSAVPLPDEEGFILSASASCAAPHGMVVSCPVCRPRTVAAGDPVSPSTGRAAGAGPMAPSLTNRPPSSGRCPRSGRRGSCVQRAKIAWKCHRAPERKQHGSAVVQQTNTAGERMPLRRFFLPGISRTA